MDLKKVVIPARSSVREAILQIELNALGFVLIVDEAGRLVGSLSDGDVRRGLLKGVGTESPVTQAMNAAPFRLKEGESTEAYRETIQHRGILHIPIVDAHGVLLRLQPSHLAISVAKRDNWIVLMAGGEGQRLRPLTENCPKPLLNIGGRPILETMLTELVAQGFSNFFFSVNFKAEMIRAHFGDGSKWGARIQYLDEDKKLGTAGPIGLLPSRSTEPLLVMNGDLLTKLDFGRMIDFHLEKQAAITMGTREYDFQVPYGVVELDGDHIRAIDEKPIQKFSVSAGIYVLSPEACDLVPKNGVAMDMPTVVTQAVERKRAAVAYPIREYWIDIGRFADLERANNEFDIQFNPLI